MAVAYWILAGLLALFYLYAGGMKLLRSRAQLAPMMQWVTTTPMWAVRGIGVLEILGAAGLILPPLTRIAPGLCVAAAVALAVLQVCALIVHLRRGDRQIAINVVAVVVAVIVAVLGGLSLH